MNNLRHLGLVVAGLGCLAAADVHAQSGWAGSERLFAGCDQAIPGDTATPSPQSPVVDRFTQRAFASFSMNDAIANDGGRGSCWARLDGVWRAETPVTLDETRVDQSVWGANGRQLMRYANGNYTTPRHVVVVVSPSDENAIYLSTGLGGDQFVRFVSNDGVSMTEVIKPQGETKRFDAAGAFPWGNRLHVDVTPNTGRLRMRLGNQVFFRPQPKVTEEQLANNDPALQAFILSQTLGYMAASRRGYDIAKQDPLYLYENPKQEVFAQQDGNRFYLAERHIVPANFQYVPEGGQGTVYRKSLITSERDIQQTEAHSFGANLSINMGTTASNIERFSASAGFQNAKESSNSMSSGQMKARALGFSRHKKYALVLDHVYSGLSMAFIEAVEEARRNHRYQALIDRFGTHYPYAVTYGASARMTMDLDETSYANRMRESESFSANAGLTIYGVGGEVNMSEQSGRSEGRSGRMANEKVTFVAVGGNGAWNHNGYTAGEDHYPILLDLRPISELLNPIYFPGDPEVYVTVRRNLEAAVARYLDAYPANNPIDTTDWTDGISLEEPEEVTRNTGPAKERWIVYVRQIWCAGLGSGRIKRAIGDRLELTGTTSKMSDTSVKVDGLETDCNYKAARKKFSYGSGSPGLISLTGTRAELRSAIVELKLRWFYDKRSRKERNDSRSFSLPVDRGMGVNDVYDEIWKVKGKTLPEFHLRVRFKRKQ